MIERKEQKTNDTWDLSALTQSPEAWDKDVAALRSRLGELEEYKGRLGESSDTLYSALNKLGAKHVRTFCCAGGVKNLKAAAFHKRAYIACRQYGFKLHFVKGTFYLLQQFFWYSVLHIAKAHIGMAFVTL